MIQTQSNTSGLLTLNVIAQLSLGLMTTTIILPSTQEWPAIFNSSQAAVQLTFSLYVVAFGLMQLIYGPLSDRMGRKQVLLFGLIVVMVGSITAAFADSLATLIMGRVIQGMGCGASLVVGRALVQDLFHGARRTRMMAYTGMAMGMVPPLATVLGGQLHVRIGWQANFVAVALAATILFIAAWRGLPGRQNSAVVQAHWLRAMWTSYARLLREPTFLLYVTILSMTTATFYTFLAGAPIVLGNYGVRPDGVGFYIMIGPLSYIAGNFLTSRLAHRVHERKLMWSGQGVVVLGAFVVLVLALSGVHTPLAFALPMVPLGIGLGLIVPPALSGTVGLLPALAGSAAAITGLSQQLLGAVGGFSVGLVSNDDAVNISLLMLGMLLIGVVAQTLLHRLAK